MFNTSFDEQNSGMQQSTACDEVIRRHEKVSTILNSAESLSIQELKNCDDLTSYRDWFAKLIKQVNKFQ